MPEISSAMDSESTLRIPLKRSWDASLSYDLLDNPENSVPRGIFVGRESLVGPLVNALTQPYQRGTYLVSGYRGVGKTSLIIEAMLRARTQLKDTGWRLFPIVLNVSEISASLNSSPDPEQAALTIDARKLLTALLRALRNRLEGADKPLRPIAEKVNSTYLKAESTKFTQTQTQKTEALVAFSRERSRAFQVSDLMKLLAALFVVAAVFAEGTVWLGAINSVHLIAVALAGLAVVSFGSSHVAKQSRSSANAGMTELIFDNSAHQLESELKDILEDLNRNKQRTVIVLEELDKINDDQGEQLESIIRYFKNLFTQAPALFFFVTDKGYYDAVGNRIDAERARGSYAIEHTFFTHRIFVVRAGVEECLSYLREILAESAIADVDAISMSSRYRARAISDMTPLEKCLRVLLFRAQDHFFDLKSQLREFIQIRENDATLEFNESVMSESDQALAAFQFLVEQKMHAYHFGGGRDYANEALRSCLFSVFSQLGTQEPRDMEALYPAEGYIGERLSTSERSRIIEALGTLTEDLERGKSLERYVDGVWKFKWNGTDPGVHFSPVIRLEPHEQSLVSELSRMSATAQPGQLIDIFAA